jgi:hypothetical protein
MLLGVIQLIANTPFATSTADIHRIPLSAFCHFIL